MQLLKRNLCSNYQIVKALRVHIISCCDVIFRLKARSKLSHSFLFHMASSFSNNKLCWFCLVFGTCFFDHNFRLSLVISRCFCSFSFYFIERKGDSDAGKRSRTRLLCLHASELISVIMTSFLSKNMLKWLHPCAACSMSV